MWASAVSRYPGAAKESPISVTTAVWVLAGMPQPLLGAADKVVQAVLLVLFVYVLVREVRAGEADDDVGA